jgi:hypothetical protein
MLSEPIGQRRSDVDAGTEPLKFLRIDPIEVGRAEMAVRIAIAAVVSLGRADGLAARAAVVADETACPAPHGLAHGRPSVPFHSDLSSGSLLSRSLLGDCCLHGTGSRADRRPRGMLHSRAVAEARRPGEICHCALLSVTAVMPRAGAISSAAESAGRDQPRTRGCTRVPCNEFTQYAYLGATAGWLKKRASALLPCERSRFSSWPPRPEIC